MKTWDDVKTLVPYVVIGLVLAGRVMTKMCNLAGHWKIRQHEAWESMSMQCSNRDFTDSSITCKYFRSKVE